MDTEANFPTPSTWEVHWSWRRCKTLSTEYQLQLYLYANVLRYLNCFTLCNVPASLCSLGTVSLLDELVADCFAISGKNCFVIARRQWLTCRYSFSVSVNFWNFGQNISWLHFGFGRILKYRFVSFSLPKQVPTIMASSSEDDKPARRVMFVRAGLQRHRDMRTSFSVGSRSIIPLHVIGSGLRLCKPVYMYAKDTVSKIALGPVLYLRAL